jgi:hypothetical protein
MQCRKYTNIQSTGCVLLTARADPRHIHSDPHTVTQPPSLMTNPPRLTCLVEIVDLEMQMPPQPLIA